MLEESIIAIFNEMAPPNFRGKMVHLRDNGFFIDGEQPVVLTLDNIITLDSKRLLEWNRPETRNTIYRYYEKLNAPKPEPVKIESPDSIVPIMTMPAEMKYAVPEIVEEQKAIPEVPQRVNIPVHPATLKTEVYSEERFLAIGGIVLSALTTIIFVISLVLAVK